MTDELKLKRACADYHDIDKQIRVLSIQLRTLRASKKECIGTIKSGMDHFGINVMHNRDTRTRFILRDKETTRMSVKWLKTTLLELFQSPEFNILTPDEKVDIVLNARPKTVEQGLFATDLEDM